MTRPDDATPDSLTAAESAGAKARAPGLFLRLSETYRDLLDSLIDVVGAKGGKPSQANVVAMALDALSSNLQEGEVTFPLQRTDGIEVGRQALGRQRPLTQVEVFSLWAAMRDALKEQSVLAGERQRIAMQCQAELWALLIPLVRDPARAERLAQYALGCLPYRPATARYAPTPVAELLAASFQEYQDVLTLTAGERPAEVIVATELEFRPLSRLLSHEFTVWPAFEVMAIMRPALDALLEMAIAGRVLTQGKPYQAPPTCALPDADADYLPTPVTHIIVGSGDAIKLQFSATEYDSSLTVVVKGGQRLVLSNASTWQALLDMLPWMKHPQASRYSNAFRRSGLLVGFNESSHYQVRIGPLQSPGVYTGLCLTADQLNELSGAVAELQAHPEFQAHLARLLPMWGGW